MATPQPANPADSAPSSTRPRSKPAAPKRIQHRAVDWATAIHIPAHYPNGNRVYDPVRVRATLVQLASWCNENVGFEPQPILEDFTKANGEPKPGILTALNCDVNIYRKCLSALGRLGFISTKSRGNRYRATRYTLHIDTLRTEYQEPLANGYSRTELSDDARLDMLQGHVQKIVDMPLEHMPLEHMPSGHVYNDRPLYRHVHDEDDMSVEGSAPMSMVADGGGASSFCSDFLIPSLEDAGLHGFTEASLAFIDLAAIEFARTHGRAPDKTIADHIAARLVGFVRDMGIDVSSEAHRVFGYLRSKQVLPLAPVEETVTLSFAPPKPSSEQPEAPAPSPPEVTLDPEAEAIWTRALDRLREKVARAAYETWLVDTVGVACEDGVFIVGVSNSFVSEMLELQVYSHIEATVQECAGDESLTVQFAVIAMPDRREAQ